MENRKNEPVEIDSIDLVLDSHGDDVVDEGSHVGRRRDGVTEEIRSSPSSERDHDFDVSWPSEGDESVQERFRVPLEESDTEIGGRNSES